MKQNLLRKAVANMQRNMKLLALGMGLALLVSGCVRYRSQVVPFRAPSSYANMQVVVDTQVAAQAYADKAAARQVFGFDVRGAGLLPVQVIMQNDGQQSLAVMPEQSFLLDAEGNLWPLLDSATAYRRVEESSEYSRIARGGGRGALLGAAGGAVLGTAIGILTGENIGSAAFKGAAVGGGGGAVVGGAGALGSDEAGRQIARDLAAKQLVNQAVPPGNLAQGFLFFPGEATSASQLRLQLRAMPSGTVHTVILPLQ